MDFAYHIIRGSQVSFYSTDSRSNTFGIYYRVKFNPNIQYCSLSEIKNMIDFGSPDINAIPADMS